MTIRTRMAPSPTGEFHIGSLRTLLYNYAWAKKNHGQFILRIEDTDQTRLVSGAQDRILQVIKDYGLDWDEGPNKSGQYGPYIQSQRLEIYHQNIQPLIDSGHAYHCFCTKETLDQMRAEQKAQNQISRYDRRCLKLTPTEIKQKLDQKLPHVIRQKLPDNQIIKYHDAVMGEIKINTKELDDTVLIKSDGFPTYHFAVVVDDHLMEITHILRAVEWISSTPKHILLYRAFAWKEPVYGHVTAILSPSGKGKMSKREDEVSARNFLDQGYLPEAILNYLMLLGWSPDNNREFFTLEEFTQIFDLKDLNSSNPKFDQQKLLHFNMHYIKNLSDQELAERLKNFIPESYAGTLHATFLPLLAPLVKERLKTLAEFKELTDFIFANQIKVPSSGWKSLASDHLQTALQITKECPENNWSTEYLTDKFSTTIETNHWHTGHFFMNLRLATSGQPVTPPITECLIILGRKKTLERLQTALNQLTP